MAINKKMSVLIIGVNYGTDYETIKFIKGLTGTYKNPLFNVNIVIVDNTERKRNDAFFKIIVGENQQLKYIKTPFNMGYFGGANYGLKTYLENNDFPDWVVVSNVDIDFKEKYFFENLCKYSNNKTGVIAPSILSEFTGHDLNPMISSRPSKYRMKFYKYCFSNYYLLNTYSVFSIIKNLLVYFYHFIRRYKIMVIKKNKFVEMKNIYAPQGSCIIFSKLFFEKGGTLNYPSFLYQEEIYIAEIARKMDLNIIYVPKLRVWHKGHDFAGVIRSRAIAAYIADSARYIADTYFQ